MPNLRRQKIVLILILGFMTALSPFSIDMYLPAFQDIAKDFGTTVARISLSLSSYFIGISCGQLFYGPLLDRFGRKKPVYCGFLIYIFASVGCVFSKSAESLILWRFVQALGGCGAGVGAMAMVRDLFTTRESAKIFSLLILILGASPMLAPTTGGYLAAAFGWHSIFVVLGMMAFVLLMAIRFLLPESHTGDQTVELRILPILRGFKVILRDPRFYTYVFSGAIAFSGMFVYLVGSPAIFLNFFGVSKQIYGWIFAIIAAGFIAISQLNVVLLRYFDNYQLLRSGLALQMSVGIVFAIGLWLGWFGLWGSVAMFFCFMCCFGVVNPNSTALSLAPFAHSAGRAAALMGFLQMGAGSVTSTTVGLLELNQILPVVAIMAGTSTLGLAILLIGRGQIKRLPPMAEPDPALAAETVMVPH